MTSRTRIEAESISSRRKKTAKRLAKRKLRVESLEAREVLTTVTMTDADQFLLELVNRARLDPVGELSFHSSVGDLNQGISPPSLTATPRQPLTSVQELVDAAGLHSEDMLVGNFFSHFSLNGDNPRDRAEDAGYSNFRTVSENLNWATILSLIHI